MPRKNKNKPDKPDKKNIEQTLEDLDINPDLDPDAAALDLDAANQSALAEESADAIPDISPVASTVEVEPVITPPPAVAPVVAAVAPVAAVPAPVEAAPTAIPDGDPLPLVVAPPAAAPKFKKGSRSPATSKLGKGLSEKLPGAERIKVYKRVEGKLGHIEDYMMRDLTGFPDMESFLNRYVKPQFGPGEYELIGVDARGNEVQAGTVLLLSPPKESENSQAAGAFGLVQTMMEQSQRQQREWMDQMKTSMQQPPQKDPLETLSGMMDLQDKVGAKGEAAAAAAEAKTEAATAAAAVETAAAGQSTMQMFMAMMQQQTAQADRQSQLMMTLLSKPKEEDPFMKMMMMKMLEEKTGGGGGTAVPPPPPPPDPMAGITALIGALTQAGLMGGGGAPAGDDEAKEMLKAMVLKSDSERMSPKDMLELFTTMRGDRGTDDFKKSADNMAMMLNLSNQMRSSTEGGATAGFFDALGALFSNRDFAGSIAQSVRSRAEGQQTSRMQVQSQQMVAQQRALHMAEREKQQRLAADARAAMPQGQPAAGAPPPANGAAAAPPQGPRLVPVPPVEEQMMPPLPANTADHVTAIADAKDDAGIIEATLRMLVYLSGFDDWRPYTEQLLGAAQEGESREMLQYLASLLEVFVKTNLMNVELAKRVLKAVQENLDLIHADLSKGTEGILDEGAEEEVDFLAVLDDAVDELNAQDADDDDDDEPGEPEEGEGGIEGETEEDSPRA